ncbi:hypothetical protein BB561_002710 [Smittium simulii]|uniref:Man1/Src1 C-terminal domain-containing protein n=1 Tax=Smittium simulii TaxID=133385 RepID=A0A2T9YPQ2_9FUNG|nr:hypothetical protein BB561_002710 [Smittium simulii]
MDEEKYLDKDFDPQTLKMSEIRNILVKHDIIYNSSAKKDELVSIFNDQVKPLSQKLSNGSEDINLSTISPYRKIKTKKNKKKSSLKPGHSSEVDGEVQSTQTLEGIQNEADIKPKTENTPEKQETPTTSKNSKVNPLDIDNIFSDDNPFQSGPESAKKRIREDSGLFPKKLKKKKKNKVRKDFIDTSATDELTPELESLTQIQPVADVEIHADKSSPSLSTPVVDVAQLDSPIQEVKRRLRSNSNLSTTQPDPQASQLDTFPPIITPNQQVLEQISYPRNEYTDIKKSDFTLPPISNSISLLKNKRSTSITSPMVTNARLSTYQSISTRTRTRRATDTNEEFILRKQSDYKNLIEKKRLSLSKMSIQAPSSPKIPENVMAIESIPTSDHNESEDFNQSKSSRFMNLGAIFRTTFSLLVLGFFWRQNSFFNAGYYESRYTSKDLNVDLPALPKSTDALFDQINRYLVHYYSIYVEPIKLNCPEHATCLANTAIPKFFNVNDPRDSILYKNVNSVDSKKKAILQCDSGFIVHYPFKISTLIFPVPPICINDKDTNTRIAELADLIVTKMQQHRGQTECDSRIKASVRLLGSKFNGFSFKDAFKAPTEFDWSLVSKTESSDFDDPDQIMAIGKHDEAVKDMIRPLYHMPQTEFEYLFSMAMSKLANDSSLGIQLINLETELTNTSKNNASVDSQESLDSNVESDTNDEDNENLELWLVANKSVYPIVCRRLSYSYEEEKCVNQIVESALRVMQLVSKYHYLDPVLAPYTNVLVDQLADYVFFGYSSEDFSLLRLKSSFKFYNLDNLTDLIQVSSNPDFSFPIANYYDPRIRQRAWAKVVNTINNCKDIKFLKHKDNDETVIESWEWIGPVSLNSKQEEN